VVQYTSCVVLMMSTFVIARQMRYINDKDLGFDKDQVLLVDVPWELAGDRMMRDRLAAFAKSEPAIVEYSGMNGGLNGSSNNNGFKLNGVQQWRRAVDVDYDYFHLLGLKLVQGRLFSRDYPTDTILKPRRVVVNETLFHMLGKTAKIGEYNEPIYAVIIGVVKDYHIMSLTTKILPEEHRLATEYEFTLMFKLKGGQTRQAIDRLQTAWKQISGNYPFSYRFLDETIAAMYTAQTEWEHIILLSCLFAVFIACMGLFGLSAINAANRTKEIGIRKVLGAGVKDIVALLSWDFLGMVLVSLVIALPLSWWMMGHWLEDFAYRIDITWWMAALVGLVAMVIALVTVSVQSFRAATANPVDSLHAD
jgi:putative ABC transport system permease protein